MRLLKLSKILFSCVSRLCVGSLVFFSDQVSSDPMLRDGKLLPQ